MNDIPASVHPAVLGYAEGRLTVNQALRMMGDDATIHDLIHQVREAGVGLPRPPREVELAQLEKARQVLAMARGQKPE